MEFTLLATHLTGAGILGILLISAINQLSKKTQVQKLIWHAKAAGVNTAFQFVSGASLVFVSPGASLWRFCANIALYLGIVITIETMLYIRIRKESGAFPKKTLQAAGFISTLFIAAALTQF